MKKLSPFINFGFLAGILLASFAVVEPTIAATQASSNGGVINSLNIFGSYLGLSNASPIIIVSRLIRVALSFIGIILLLMILSSGWQFLVSGGDEEKVSSAKRTFFNSIIGAIIILSSYSIVSFALNTFSAAST